MSAMKTTLQDLRKFFTPVIRREGGVYCAEVPSMPGCFTVADTPDELKSNLVEAMQCWLLTRQDLRRARAATTATPRHRPSLARREVAFA